jgi:serralysin
MSTIYVGPSASGNGSGSSASDALSIKSLDKAIQLAGAGGTVVLLSDHGAYNITSSINLSHGGTDGASVNILGEDSSGHASNITINGTRAATYTPGMSAGDTIFRLTTGANDLNFQHITFNNVGMAFLAASDVHDIAIGNMTANNVQYFMSDYASVSGGTASVSNLSVSNVDVQGFSKGVIRLQYDSHDIKIDNVSGDSMHEDGDGIAMGIHFDGTAHNITVSNSTMENAIASGSYYNGDGFTAEAGVYNLTFENDVSRGNADAGFDIKASGTKLIDCTADDNGRNFRLWSNITLNNCVGLDPHKQGGTTGGQEQIQVLHGSTVTVIGGSFSDSGSSTRVVLFDNGGTINFSGSEIVYAGTLHAGTGTFVIDPTAVSTVASTGIFSTNGASLVSVSQTPVPLQPADQAPTGATFTGGTIAENSAAGTLVGTVHGIDPDASDTLSYTLSDNAGGRFLIDAHTGAVTVASGAVLDYETQSSFAIKAVVTDSQGLTYTAPLTVSLTDVAETTSSHGKGHKAVNYSGSVGLADVANPGFHSSDSTGATQPASATLPGTNSSTVHVYGAGSAAELIPGVDSRNHASSAAHSAALDHVFVPHAVGFVDFDHAHLQLFGGTHLHESDFLY